VNMAYIPGQWGNQLVDPSDANRCKLVVSCTVLGIGKGKCTVTREFRLCSLLLVLACMLSERIHMLAQADTPARACADI